LIKSLEPAGGGGGGGGGDLREGSKVEARYRGKARYYPGVIKRVNRDGTYDVDYDDGEKEMFIAAELVRLLEGSVSHGSPVHSRPAERPYDRPSDRDPHDRPYDRPSDRDPHDRPYDRPSDRDPHDRPYDRPSDRDSRPHSEFGHSKVERLEESLREAQDQLRNAQAYPAMGGVGMGNPMMMNMMNPMAAMANPMANSMINQQIQELQSNMIRIQNENLMLRSSMSSQGAVIGAPSHNNVRSFARTSTGTTIQVITHTSLIFSVVSLDIVCFFGVIVLATREVVA